MIKLTKEQFEVPASVMLQVSSLICEHELPHEIIEVDEDDDTITLELQYSRQERSVIHIIEDLIADSSDEEDDDEEDNEE